MTTTEAPRRKRASKGLLRTWAWVVGAISFFGPATAIGLQPREATAQSQPHRAPDVVIHHVVRRIVIHERPKQTTGGTAAVYSSPTQTVAAPPPPLPPATTRGS